MHIKRIHQYHDNAAYGDAVTNCMLLLRDLLIDLGFDSEIFSKNIDPRLSGNLIKDFTNLIESDILLYHHSAYSQNLESLFTLTNKIILIYHNITPSFYFKEKNILVKSLNQGVKQLETYREKFHSAIAVSDINYFDLQEKGYNNIAKLPLLIDSRKFNKSKIKSKESSCFNIIFVGRIVENKNQISLLDVLNYLLKFGIQAKLYIVGSVYSDNYLENIFEKIIDLNLSEHVIITGKVTNDALRMLYGISDLFLCMSTHEGFGVPLVEAMYYEIPVFAIDHANIKYTLNGTGVLFELQNSFQIAQYIHRLSEDFQWRDSIVESQKRLMAGYEYEKIKNELIKYFNILIKGYGNTDNFNLDTPIELSKLNVIKKDKFLFKVLLIIDPYLRNKYTKEIADVFDFLANFCDVKIVEKCQGPLFDDSVVIQFKFSEYGNSLSINLDKDYSVNEKCIQKFIDSCSLTVYTVFVDTSNIFSLDKFLNEISKTISIDNSVIFFLIDDDVISSYNSTLIVKEAIIKYSLELRIFYYNCLYDDATWTILNKSNKIYLNNKIVLSFYRDWILHENKIVIYNDFIGRGVLKEVNINNNYRFKKMKEIIATNSISIPRNIKIFDESERLKKIIKLRKQSALIINDIENEDIYDLIDMLYNFYYLRYPSAREKCEILQEFFNEKTSMEKIISIMISTKDNTNSKSFINFTDLYGLYEIDKNFLVNLNDDIFIKYSFRALFKREVDKFTLLNYAEKLKNDFLNKEDVLYELIESAEGKRHGVVINGLVDYYNRMSFTKDELLNLTDSDFIKSSYRALFKREVDRDAFSQYMSKINDGFLNKEDVLYELKESDEGKRHGVVINGLIDYYNRMAFTKDELVNLMDSDFIKSSYRALFKREVDQDAFSQYMSKINDGFLNKEDVLYELKTSEEGRKYMVMIIGLVD